MSLFKKKKIVIVGSTNCGHCKKQRDIALKMKKEGYNVDMKYVEKGNVPQKYLNSINGVPAIFFHCDTKGKNPVGKIEGVRSKEKIDQLLKKVDDKCKKG